MLKHAVPGFLAILGFLNFLKFFFTLCICVFSACMYMYVPHVCLMLGENRCGHWITWNWRYRGLWPPYECLELNPCSLQEQPVCSLPAGPALRFPGCTFKDCCLFIYLFKTPSSPPILRVKPSALWILGNQFTTEPHWQPLFFIERESVSVTCVEVRRQLSEVGLLLHVGPGIALRPAGLMVSAVSSWVV